ncbi:unnamed protein product [Schistosoma bovis]|nr:unnamed protein product [Schistosoma bovis]
MQHESNTSNVEHLKTFDVRSSEMRSASMHEIVNSCPSVQSDRITRYASPNRFDIRDAPRSFLDSYRAYRYPQNHGVNLSRSKLRSTMPTSFSSYAVPSLNEVTSSMSTSKSLDINVVKNQEELPLQGGDRCCDKYISSICAKKVSTRNQPVGYANSDQLNSIERHSSDYITTCSSTPNHNSNSFVKISHHHTPITTSLICSSSPSSTIYTNEPLVHRNSHPDQRYSSYCQEISKLNLSSQQHSVISQSINNDNNNNTVSNDASSSNNDRLESTINCHIVAQKEFEQTWDKHNSHVNYDSCIKTPTTGPRDYLSTNEQIEMNMNKTNEKMITFVNHQKNPYINHNINLTEDNDDNTPIQKQTIYPFKTNSFRSVKYKHKNFNKNMNRQQPQQQKMRSNYENEINLKPEIKLIDSRPRTRLCIQSGIETHTKTMTLQRNLITDDSLNSNDLNMIGYISLPNQKISTRKIINKLSTSPSMPLPNVISTDHCIYNVNLSEIDHYSEPYNSSSTCESLIEYKQTDKLIMDNQNDPELTVKLDRIACEIGLLHHQKRMGRKSSLSSQCNVDGSISINSPCSESNLPKADLDQFLTLEISTIVSNPAYVSSSKNDTTITTTTTTLQTNSTSLNNSKITDSRHRTHLSRVDSSLTNTNQIKSQNRPNSTGSRIIKEFLRHISPKLRRSLSRISSRKKSENQKLNQDDNHETNFNNFQPSSNSFERCKSERIYPKKSLLRFIPRCSSRSKERKRKQVSTTEANTQIIPSYSLNTNIMRSDTNKTTTDEDKKSNNSSEIDQQSHPLSHDHHRDQYYSRYYENYFNKHPQSRPVSIALPVDKDRNDEITSSPYNQLQTNCQLNQNNTLKTKEFDHLTFDDRPEPTYLNAALNAFGYGCKPDWKHFCVSPSARRLAHAKQSMKVKQIESDSCNTTLSNNNTEYDEISNNKKMDYDDHENENKITNEKCTDSKLKQTIEYSCDNDTMKHVNVPINKIQSIEKCTIIDNETILDTDPYKAFIEQQNNQYNIQHKDDPIILSKYVLDKSTIDQNRTNELFDKSTKLKDNTTYQSSDQLLISLTTDDMHEQNDDDNNNKMNSNNIILAIKSKTPPIKRRNTAFAIKAKSAKLKQPLNIFIPANIRCHNKLSAAISKANETDCIQLKKKEELTTLFEDEQSLKNQDITATTTNTTDTTTTTTTTINNNNNAPSDNLSTLFYSSLSRSSSLNGINELMKRYSSSSNELYNHSDTVHNNNINNNSPFEHLKNTEINNNSYLELSTNNDIDYVIHLLKYIQTFEYQLMNVIHLARNTIDQNNHSINDHDDDVLKLTNENLNNDELLTGIGHIQMLINGNLTMLRKLCKVYLETNTQIKKQQSMNYIPLKSDLEGYWNLILLQYKRFESQFPILVNWISNDFRNELQILIKESLGDLPSCSSEFISSSYMNKECKKKSTKQTNIALYKKKLSGINKNHDKSIQLHRTIQQRINNARKQLLEKQKILHEKHDMTMITNENDTGDNSICKNTYFYTIEY